MGLVIKLAFRNILRNRRRTLISGIMVALSVGFLIFGNSYFHGFLTSFYSDLMRFTGHVRIQHPEYSIKERMLSLHFTVDSYESIINEIRVLSEVKEITGRIKFGALLYYQEENEPGIGMGIDPVREIHGFNIEKSLVDGEYFSGAGDETIIGAELARKLNLSIGDTLTVLGRTPSGAMTGVNARIIGIASLLQTNLNKIAFLPLETVRNTLDMQEESTEMVVFLYRDELSAAVAQRIRDLPGIRDRFEVLTWTEASGIDSFLPMMSAVMVIMHFIFMFVAMLGIVNTILMSVFERTREIGLMEALGMKPWKVLILFIYEGMFIGIVGGIAGVPLGSGLGYYLETYGITLGKAVEDFPLPMREVIYGDLTWEMVITSFLLGVAASMAASFLPALKAARLTPVRAFRSY